MPVASTGLFTVISQEALTPLPSLADAVIVAVPGCIAVTVPVVLTAATLRLLLDHVMVLSVALSGDIVAVSSKEAPEVKLIDVSFNEMLVTGWVIVTVQAADKALDVVAEITAVPADKAVTCPFEFTVATDGLLLDHVTVWSIA